ncbi:MAG: MBL fold metallo-hydrolase [Halioglobus sp.]
MKKPLIVLGTIVALLAIAYSQRALIAERVMEKALPTRMGADTLDQLQDGLHVGLCGAGGPMPSPVASGPCVVVAAGQQLFMVDSGTNGVRNLARMGFQPGTLDAVLLTHFHSDHLDGLGETGTIRWAGGDNKTPLPVYGPKGIKKVVKGFNLAYSHDFTYRHDHHGDTVAPLSGAGLKAMQFDKPAMGELTTVIADGDLKVEALAVDHAPIEPAVGYRFSYKGRSVLITGDTIKLANIEKFAKGVDVLVHEGLAPNLVNMMHDAAVKTGNPIMAQITHDILNYHTSPVEAAETARDAGVGHLLYYHIVPPLIFPGQDLLYLDGAEDIFPNYTLGQDGVLLSLPANSSEILTISDGL